MIPTIIAFIKQNYSDKRLIQLTNIDTSGATIDDTMLENAVRQSVGIYEADTRRSFDETDYEHLYFAENMTIAILKMKTGDKEAKGTLDSIRTELKEKRKSRTVNSKFKAFADDVDDNGESTGRFSFYFD